jgi:hypothetical protein
MKENQAISLSGYIAIALLLALAGINTAWMIMSSHGGTLIALAFYLIVAFLCLVRRHFRAGVIAGIFGFGVHAYEWFAWDTAALTGLEQAFFYANLLLPIPLAITSALASRKELPNKEV